jgi:methyl-accepting chemotaxis protein
MNWLIDLSTRNKLFGGFGFIIFCIVIVMIIASVRISTVQKSHETLFENYFANATNLLSLEADINGMRAALVTMSAVKNRSEMGKWQQDAMERASEISNIMKILLEKNRNDPRLFKGLEEFNRILNDFGKTRDKEVIPLINDGKSEEARALVLGIQAERYKKMRSIASQLGDAEVEQARKDLILSKQNANNSLLLFVVFCFIATLFSFVISMFLNGAISKPLKEITITAQKIAGGDLAVEVTSEARQDEIGSLARAFTLMIQSLKEKAQIAEKLAASDLTVKVTPLSDADTLGNAFATMVEKLRGQIQQIIEGVNVLASSGSEIMASVSQLTSGAAETATSVSETTTTVEEVKQTAEMTHQKAKLVSDLGQKNAEISRAGLKSIEDTINGMNRIREQMESIADMVIRLSEQSQAIGEIIATVNDIAEQSNLLAVNASIEAAKAGEQGKGFAVVAQEIRSLAAQSKQATTQVRNILFDVQKAISSAVMATEQGSKAVEEGVRLSTQAGESIDTLVESVVKESTNAAIQIAASSQQQLIGMDQVVSAMENIRESSLQMASSTKQTEKAAHDLHNLGQRLQEIVKLYKV